MTDTAIWAGVTDADLIGIQLVTDRPDISWTVTPGGKPRPATEVEQEKYDSRRLRDDWAWLYGADGGILPTIRPAVVMAVPVPAEPAGAPDPAPPAEPEPAVPVTIPEAPATIPAQAADRLGLGPLDPAKEAVAAQFIADHEAEDKRTGTAEIPVVDAVTETTPAVADGGAA